MCMCMSSPSFAFTPAGCAPYPLVARSRPPARTGRVDGGYIAQAEVPLQVGVLQKTPGWGVGGVGGWGGVLGGWGGCLN